MGDFSLAIFLFVPAVNIVSAQALVTEPIIKAGNVGAREVADDAGGSVKA
jgi:hypothetical protein